MAQDWRNTRKRDAAPSEMISVRTPAILKHRAQAVAEAGNSSLAAAVRWGLEKFLEENDPPASAAPPTDLFE